MAKKAALRFQPIDYEYQRMYGKMPDYDYTDRITWKNRLSSKYEG